MERTAIFIAIDFGKKLRKAHIFVFLILLLLFWLKSPLNREQAFGFLFIFVSLAVIFSLWEAFFQQKIKKPVYKISLNESLELLKKKAEAREFAPSWRPDRELSTINLMGYLDYDCARVIDGAARLCKKKKRLLDSLSILSEILEEKRIRFIFNRSELNLKEFRREVKEALNLNKEGTDFPLILRTAAEFASSRWGQTIEIGDFFAALSQGDPIFQKFIFDKKLNPKDILNLTNWERGRYLEEKIKGKFWDYRNLMRIGSLGKAWAAGYTPSLDYFSFDLTQAMEGYSTGALGRREEIESIERILSKAGENNVIVVGDSDIAKRGVLYGFAALVINGQTVPSLNFKRVVMLDVDKILSGLKTPGEIRMRFNQVLSEVVGAGNVILAVEDIHNFIGSKASLGVDVSGILLSYLKSPKFQLIALTNFLGYHQSIAPFVSFSNLFDKVEIQEPSKEESLLVIENLIPGLEKKYKLFISYGAAREIIELSDRFIQDVPFPEKAIRLLQEVVIFVSRQKNKKLVLPKDVQEIVSGKVEIPIGELQAEEKEKLKNLEKIMHKRIVNQEEAVVGVCSAMRRARTGVAGTKKPIGTFLFLGPTGVGKTETTKTLAEAYFGSEKRMIRLDMSEYQQIDAINRLIGSPDGKEPGYLTTAIREDPFSLVLLDEIEKAHFRILNLFLQVLDEGRLTDSLGRTVSFLNAIIIGTSNAGAEFIRQVILEGKNLAVLKNELLDRLQRENIFRPEFLNRFDDIIIFKPLTKEHLSKIAHLMLNSLNKRLLPQGIGVSVTPELLEKLVELGSDPTFGARAMKRVIQDKVENFIANKLLEGEAKRGEMITIDPQTITNTS
ncbi:MAG: hypothetical protein COV69_03980 [Parcubacteria group bacterium CG11_big_fil_rev_8_21_14_0_20_39_14]|nr:MAG: hypothetical protein COV69_03980 [Parcubacteria group bacterium CG11_big_fil_rev_8_21_14_0_20_39_14]PIS35747.1 MAG: hypothetical protein COT36_00775 [Parcubacteria group bacterium CG08_land_8_20_14_0_20_38_56]